ncbi:MAG: hypothetical protein ACRD3T_03110 [Terriglobia bacterium]
MQSGRVRFRRSRGFDLHAVVTKIDLAAAVEYDWPTASNNIQSVRPDMEMIRVSAKTDEGMSDWLQPLSSYRNR